MKRCVKCGESRPASEFQVQRVSPRGVTYYKARCNGCVAESRRRLRATSIEHRARKNAQALAWRKANPEKYQRSVVDATLRYKYGIGFDDYERLLAAQGGGCAICGNKRSHSKGGGRFHVDHCHATGVVRGLLCQGCNTTLGQMRDSPELLKRAAEYLELHKKPELVAA